MCEKLGAKCLRSDAKTTHHRLTILTINKFNIYRSSFTKTPILDTYIYKLDLSRVTYSGIKINPNKII